MKQCILSFCCICGVIVCKAQLPGLKPLQLRTNPVNVVDTLWLPPPMRYNMPILGGGMQKPVIAGKNEYGYLQYKSELDNMPGIMLDTTIIFKMPIAGSKGR